MATGVSASSLSFLGLLRSASQRIPGKIVVEDDTCTRTCRELLLRSEALARYLLRRLENAEADGRVIAILAENSVAYAETVFGAAFAGLPLVTVNPRLSSNEVAGILADSGAVLLLVDQAHAGRAAELHPECIVLGEALDASLDYDDAGPRLEPVEGSSAFTIPYTSGTTGKPKGVVVSHQSRLLTVLAMQIEYGCFGSDDRFVALAPMCHGAGLAFAIAPICLGGYVRIVSRFDPQGVLELLNAANATGVFMVPTHFSAIFDLPSEVLAANRPGALRAIVSNAAPLPQPTKEKIVEYFGEGLLHETYGSTEAGIVSNLRPPDQLRKLRCVGPPFLGNEVSIRDDQGRECDVDEVGELHSRSPYLFSGYWNNPAETESAWADGWVTVGDMARRDGDGYVYIVDRKKDMVISGGVNIYPSEVENILAQHPAIADVAVIGVPDDKWGEALKAFIVPAAHGDTPEPDDLIEFCSERLSRYKVPRLIETIDAIPRNPTGKVLKAALRSAG